MTRASGLCASACTTLCACKCLGRWGRDGRADGEETSCKGRRFDGRRAFYLTPDSVLSVPTFKG